MLGTKRVCVHIFQTACAALNLSFLAEIYPGSIGRNAAGIEKVIR